MNIRQKLLGTPIGALALYAREKSELIRSAFSNPESIGTLANDQLAGRLVCSIGKKGETFLDVGAHIGSVIAEVKSRNPAINVIAIEAIPEKVERLRSKFPATVIHNFAVGEKAGEANFYIDTMRSGYSSLFIPKGNSDHIREIHVTIESLDNLISESIHIDIIKIDIEGAELGAFRGATRILSQNKPLIMFESAPAEPDAAYSKEDLYCFLCDRDYLIVAPNRLAHNDDGLSETGFLEAHLYPRLTTNFFAVHKSRRIEFRDRARIILKIQVPKNEALQTPQTFQ